MTLKIKSKNWFDRTTQNKLSRKPNESKRKALTKRAASYLNKKYDFVINRLEIRN